MFVDLMGLRSDDSSPQAPARATPRSSPNIVVIACSAGGFTGLVQIVSSLDARFPAAIAIVQHRGQSAPERLPSLLQRHTALKVQNAQDGDVLEAGTVYICPPGTHMTTEHCVRLVDGPKLNHVRPSADLMLQSVARAYGERAFAVVLSGAGSDATAGCAMIGQAGGTVFAQAPSSCEHAGMPSSVIAAGHVNLVLSAEEIGALLRHLPDQSPSDGGCPATSVVIADDHRMTLDGLRTLLRAEAGIHVIAEAEDGRAAVELAVKLSPDVMVLDIGMPKLDGLRATHEIREKNPRTSIIVLSARVDESTATKVLQAGALGYVSKTEAFTELRHAIRSVAARRPYFSPRVAPLIARATRARAAGIL
jgi:two-component system chemotaxis response regulator CheB